MEWGYEEKYDLLGIILKNYKPSDYDRSEELKPGFIIDILKDGEIGAVEILDWGRSCGLLPHQVREMDIDVKIEKQEFSIRVTVIGKYKDKTHKEVGGIYL